MALEQYAGHLEPLRVRESYGADLPRGVLMQNLLGFSTAEELRQQLQDNWQRSVEAGQADWLNVALGQLSGGDVRRLKFSADADGVHGLIAGSTGSGKSELLMTMILGLAYNYDPTIVNFVLVDFKGGAAFEPFRNLPHCVDIVTNLGGNAVERMFAAIMAEIHRREAINVATGSKHIVHYRKNGLHKPPYGSPVTVKGQTFESAPYPHLFVFIDEFAEMIAENPEYKAQLNSITRLGRALGVTLILAAQRPTGVTDQMRANIKFRIALRVETREESAEVLRRPDAAYLPTGVPGRGYLQVGNENVELIQVAWTGSEYRGGMEEVQPDVIWHDRPRKAAAASADEAPKVFEVMVDTMADLAREHSLPQSKPWPDFLPTSISLQTPLDVSHMAPEGLNALLSAEATVTGEEVEQQAAPTIRLNSASARWLRGEGCCWSGVDWESKAMRAVVGLIDDPHHAEQTPLVVDLRRGHAAVFGASGWGKTTLLRTLITTLVTTQSPQELHVYILDFGGRQLSVFQDLPHVGAIITPDEEDRVTRLLRQVDRVLEERKAVLSSARADDLYSYNRSQ
ncbi:MAG: FtsK/SpoIIIE domain-containing protein, partial [Anaerolineae bacterium]